MLRVYQQVQTVIATFMVTALVACTSPPDNSVPSDSRTQRADDLLQSILIKDGGPGVMAVVIKNGEIIWSGAAGYANLEHKIAMTPHHRLRIGSVSKPITTALALRMAQSGLFDLNKDIGKYVSEFPQKSEPISALMLGSHTSGIRHYDFSNYYEANNVTYKQTLTEGIEVFANDQLKTPPGSAFHYSSLGFNLLGAALENASNRSFTQAIDTFVTQPAGLKNTRTDHPFDIIDRRSGFYTVTTTNPVFSWMKDGEVINTILRDGSDYYPSGGMLSSASDLASFTYQVFNGDFLSPESKSIITQPAQLSTGKSVEYKDGSVQKSYSFGWELGYSASGQIEYYGHNGETNGGYALVRYFPEYGIAVAGIANYNMVMQEPLFFDVVANQIPQIFQN